MKKFIFACALFLSLGVLASCDKDDKDKDEPSGSSKVDGSVKVDGNNFDLNYGFAFYEDDYAEYYFFDKDMLKYMDDDLDELDMEYSALFVDYDGEYEKIDDVIIMYKYNGYRGKGNVYVYNDDDADEYMSISDKNSNVKISARALPMEGYSYTDKDLLGTCNATFSVEGKIKAFYDEDYDEYSTRGIEVKEVKDPKQHAFLRSLVKKQGNMADRK